MPAAKTANNKHLNTPPTNAQYNASHIDVTKEEFDRISEAMKKEEFRKLFIDYCEEIQDPENRKRYEEEIIQLEAERGVDVRFVNPEPGFVIKTSVNGQTKCFVNVAKSKQVGAPSNQIHLDNDTGKRGLNWSLPMAQAAPREDLDAAGKRCTVYDVVFHPDTLRLAENNKAFHKCVVDTALDAVERAFEVKLDRTNLKFPKLDFKGVARPTVIRTLSKNAPLEDENDPHPLENIYPAKPTMEESEPKTLPLKMNITKPAEFTTPKYHIKHRRGVDYAECTNELDAKLNIMLPHELVVNIELPLLKSTAECQLDVTSRKIYLLSERVGAKYRLNLDLPYEVIDKDGVARFDTETRKLEITLPVKKISNEEQREMLNALLHKEDSGVESDVRDEIQNTNSPRDSPIEADSLIESDDATTTTVQPETSEIKDFLNANTLYKLPHKFDCNVLDNMMSLVLHVFNVQQESIKLLQKSNCIHLQFVSMGSGYVPTYYAFYFELPKTAGLEIEAAQAEAWENNVVLNITLTPSNASAGDTNIACQTYLAGLNSEDLKEYAVQGKFEIPVKAQHTGKSPCYMDVMVEREEKAVEVAVRPRAHTPPRNYTKNEGTTANKKRNNKKTRSYSESACDDFNKVYNRQQADNANANNNVSHELTALQQDMETLNCSVADEKKEKADEKEEEQAEKMNTVNLIERTQARAIPKHNHNNKNNNKQIQQQQQQQRNKQRSYSECRSDSVCSSTNTLPPSFKGILKHRSSYDKRPSISDSCCSSFDDSSYGCSADTGYTGCYSLPKSFNKCIKEEEETGENAHMSESCKKTVRFSDNIKQQIFRMDSSILGRRKKNQKCRNRKLRALQRRLSEGDSADYEDSSHNAQQTTNNNNNKPNNEKMCYFKQPQQQQQNDKNCKKHNKNKEKSMKSRSRLESESSSDVENHKNSMMFEIEM